MQDGDKSGRDQLRHILPELWRQLKALWLVLVLIYTPVAVAFGIVIIIRLTTGIAIAEFTRDPLGFTGIPVYKGSLSNIGVLVWSSAAAICLFTYGIVRGKTSGSNGSHFLLFGGLISMKLLLDDLFMLHEVVYPENLGIPENVVYGSYVVMLLAFVVWYRSTILQSNFLLLVLAFVGFGMSVGTDLLAGTYSIPGLYIFEDGGKLFGIVSWSAYFIQMCARQVSPALIQPRTDDRLTQTQYAQRRS